MLNLFQLCFMLEINASLCMEKSYRIWLNYAFMFEVKILFMENDIKFGLIMSRVANTLLACAKRIFLFLTGPISPLQ